MVVVAVVVVVVGVVVVAHESPEKHKVSLKIRRPLGQGVSNPLDAW